MVGSTGSLMTMRLVRSKLRKREESISASPASIEAQDTNFGPHRRSSSSGNNCNNNNSNGQPQQQRQLSSQSAANAETLVKSNNNKNNVANQTLGHSVSEQQVSFTRTSGGGGSVGVDTNSWVFPPKAPTPNIYNCNNNFDALIAANDKNGFKGFRKQFSGRFKRLVAKKPQEPASAIPPELKPQLKTIYVY